MRILALLPEIHERPTGGNLFNRHALSCLGKEARVETLVVDPSRMPTSLPAADAVLVDSLLLAPAAEHLSRQQGARVVLAHYFRVFEPSCRGGAEAEMERRYLPEFDGVMTTSEYCRGVLISEGFRPEQLAAVTPGLAPSYAEDPVSRAPGPPRILTVATLLEGKGLRKMAAVLETLLDLSWSWEIAGDPGLDPTFGEALRASLQGSPIADRVHLHGAVAPADMVALYDRCHIFALLSQFETCSMATMEAMSRALPVVAYRVGGIPERLAAANAACLPELDDQAGVASLLRQLLTDPRRSAALGRENREASCSFPTWEASGENLWRFIRRCVDRG